MKKIGPADVHKDKRRDLTAWRPEGFSGAEVTCIIVNEDGAKLGNHSHPFNEFFILAAGKCTLFTWNARDLGARYHLKAPYMFIIEEGEEHLLVCEKGTVINAFAPVTFLPEHLIAAKHLKSI